MSSKVKVSIIIPVYDVEKYLEKCIQSVISQTLQEIEVFLIDDGSTDQSWKIIQKFAKKDKRLKPIRQENAGAAVARNRGLEQATGEYIGFVDSDDYVDFDYFEQLYKAAKAGKADIARAYVKAEIETSDDYQLIHSVEGYNSYYNVRLKRSVSANKLNLTSSNWLAVYRRSLITKNKIAFVPEIRTGQDNIFNLHVSYYANKVVFVEKATYYHMVRRDGSLMTDYNFTTKGLASRALVIDETVSFLNKVDDYDKGIYISRVKDVFEFFHTRLIKTKGLTSEIRKELADILVPAWAAVKYKKEIARLFNDEGRFIKSLASAESFDKYLRYLVPTRRVLSNAERRRLAVKATIKRNKVVYKTLKPPVLLLRKVNRLVTRVLS